MKGMQGMPIRFYSGTTKEAADEGYEKLDATADNQLFKWSRQNPSRQGWRDEPAPMMVSQDSDD
jgi:hypothetical protein